MPKLPARTAKQIIAIFERHDFEHDHTTGSHNVLRVIQIQFFLALIIHKTATALEQWLFCNSRHEAGCEH
jgi:predicted RNA binding protein YcfA (HicA-like mRNA interferase family)